MKSIIQKFGLTIAATAMIFTGCKDENAPIVPTFSPDIVSVAEGSAATSTIMAGTEPFKVQSENTTVATVTVDGKTITIMGVAEGQVNISVTGNDGGTGRLAVSVTQRDPNAPTLSENLPGASE